MAFIFRKSFITSMIQHSDVYKGWFTDYQGDAASFREREFRIRLRTKGKEGELYEEAATKVCVPHGAGSWSLFKGSTRAPINGISQLYDPPKTFKNH